MIIIDKTEVLRYLRYKNQPINKELSEIIDRIINETREIIAPKYTYKMFDIEHTADGVCIAGTDAVLCGNDIKNHLKECQKCILLACTLGIAIEKKIMAKQIISVNEALIMDSCATTAIEEVCDNVEVIIRKDLNISDCSMNYRYSPGYGDFDIAFQPTFLDLLDTGNKIGLYTTSSNIMTPRKSVTAIIGVTNKTSSNTNESNTAKNKCDLCENRERCMYRKHEKK